MKEAFRQLWRVLTFRTTAEDVAKWCYWELGLGLICTWLVGIGRWWDDPRDLPLPVTLGLGSIAYVWIFTFVMWVLIHPIVDNPPTILQVLTFVCFVSPPAALYAIPVEHWTGMETAIQLNLAFLFIVAVYRVSLLIRFFVVAIKMSIGKALLTTFLPISIAIVSIAVMNMMIKIIEFMGGVREEASRRTSMEQFVVIIRDICVVAAPILILCYLWTLYREKLRREDS
jgi:hypothetical protein